MEMTSIKLTKEGIFLRKKLLAALVLLVLMLACVQSALAYTWMEFEEGAWMSWESVSNDQLKIRVKVTNSSSYHTIRAFEMYVYATDVWGERIYDHYDGDNRVYYWTTKKTVKPGETVYTDWVTIPKRSEIYQIHCGVHKDVTVDGDVNEAYSVNYWNWTYK